MPKLVIILNKLIIIDFQRSSDFFLSFLFTLQLGQLVITFRSSQVCVFPPLMLYVICFPQGTEPEEAYLPTNSLLRPLWPWRVHLGSAQGAQLLNTSSAGPDRLGWRWNTRPPYGLQPQKDLCFLNFEFLQLMWCLFVSIQEKTRKINTAKVPG